MTPNICLQGMFVFFFLQAKYDVAFVGVNLFACVVVVFFCGFCFGSKVSKGKKKDSRCTEESVFVRACRSLFCAGEWEGENKNKKKEGRVGF